jgi:hypothetical protein
MKFSSRMAVAVLALGGLLAARAEASVGFVAVVDGTAPNVVTDRDGNGVFDERDLALMGFNVVSNVRKIDFTIKGF